MEIKKEYKNDELIMSPIGRLDTITSDDLNNAIIEEKDNLNSLILNFQGVDYISSAGLRVLISNMKSLKNEDKSLTIINVNDTILEIFKMSGFDKILKIE
ncbi:MAG: STAS domain-containing protein [Methanobrevibacter sp.]|nr:STAS domain-containing protein [Methanobrevibacter sp.]